MMRIMWIIRCPVWERDLKYHIYRVNSKHWSRPSKKFNSFQESLRCIRHRSISRGLRSSWANRNQKKIWARTGIAREGLTGAICTQRSKRTRQVSINQSKEKRLARIPKAYLAYLQEELLIRLLEVILIHLKWFQQIKRYR